MSTRRTFLGEAARLAAAAASASASSALSAALPAQVGPGPQSPPLDPEKIARFVDPLPIPAVLAPRGSRPDPAGGVAPIPFYRVSMREVEAKLHRDLPATRLWTYEGTTPGPTIETQSGRGLLVEWINELPDRHLLPIDHTLHGAGPGVPDVRAIVHVHGAKAPPESDGFPEDWYVPGKSATFHYPNRQDAAMLWYHDHAMGIERLNHYAGLFGVFLIRDRVEDALQLPRGAHEIPLVLCDRMFDTNGQLRYPVSPVAGAPWVEEVLGDVHLVNGKVFPFLEVERTRYRFRVVNASNGRPYALSVAGGPQIIQIGSDQGLLAAPVAVDSLLLTPAERADIVVDFREAKTGTVSLQDRGRPILEFRVAAQKSRIKPPPLPHRLRPIERLAPSVAVRTRDLVLNGYHDSRRHRMVMLLNDTRWHEPVTESPVLDSVEIWSLLNLTADDHPIHLHLVRFQILDRQPFDAGVYRTSGKIQPTAPPVPPAPAEAGWKDTVRVPPRMVTRIIARFEGFPGKYVWHCHVLEHAANEMMRPFEVVAP